MNEIKKHTDAIARFNSAELDLGTCRKLEIINQEADRLEKEIISLKTEIKRKDEKIERIQWAINGYISICDDPERTSNIFKKALSEVK